MEKYKEIVDNVVRKTLLWEGIEESRLTNQINVLHQVIDAYEKGFDNVIIEAPTGFGKSILGFMIAECFKYIDVDNQAAYILTSNKFLQEQYVRDIKKFKLDPNFAELKGQSNYTCKVNNLPFTKRSCIKSSFNKAMDLPCSKDCEYLIKRNQLIFSDVGVLNYNYWLTTMNMVYESMKDFAPLQPRSVTILDECHVLQSIIQDSFATEINSEKTIISIRKHFYILNQLYGNRLIEDGIEKTDKDKIDDDILKFKKYSKVLTILAKKQSTEYDKIMIILREFVNILSSMLKPINKIIDKFFPEDEENLSDDQSLTMDFVNELVSLISKFKKLIEVYEISGSDKIVLDIVNKKNDSGVVDEKIRFRCLDEAELIKNHLLKYTKFAVFMSATIGDIDIYAKNHGISNYIPINVLSDFDLTKSPIKTIYPELNMSFRYKTKNMPILLKRIEIIINKFHENEKGLIHTGNYAFMKELQDFVKYKPDDFKNRFLFCSNADEKRNNVKLMEIDKSTPYILVGASLLEGVDLKDDLSRFCIFMKVPYVSLADLLVKRKIDYYPSWYSWHTMVDVLQGLGRTVRNKHDWSVFYLLDGSFASFFQRYGDIPKTIKQRLKSQHIDNDITDEEEMFNM